MQYRTQGDTDQQQHNQVGHACQTRQAVGKVCHQQQNANYPEYARQFHDEDLASKLKFKLKLMEGHIIYGSAARP